MLPCARAGTGNLALAAGKGMGKPAFRIIQTHFAADNNVGDVAAKEEVRRQAEARLATVPTWHRPHTLRRCQ